MVERRRQKETNGTFPLMTVGWILFTAVVSIWIGFAVYCFHNYHIAWNIFWGWFSVATLGGAIVGFVIDGINAGEGEKNNDN